MQLPFTKYGIVFHTLFTRTSFYPTYVLPVVPHTGAKLIGRGIISDLNKCEPQATTMWEVRFPEPLLSMLVTLSMVMNADC